ncbi:MAG TPA: TerC/Alx family metal homeostasis membrane protein [Myxococcaceae bacterium]|nr:TerC/Alx family metal homeostasis membrane protein [Myxococcaceae bacterium]
MGTPALWLGFHVVVLALLAVDLGLVNRGERGITARRAATMVGFTVVIAALLAGGVWRFQGRTPAIQFVTVYLLEYALSVDNLFVFLLVFTFFKVAPQVRHRVLFWGVLGAFVMRATLIVLGTSLVKRFEWLLYGFGAFLLYTAVKMAFSKEEDEVNPESSFILRWGRRLLPVARSDTEHYHFFTREGGKLRVTPIFLVLGVVEGTDLLFALDSIPAALGVSSDAFVVYTANVSAILGLRSLFFVVASLMDKFHYLKLGLSAVLAFIGAKMLAGIVHVKVPEWLSLTVIAVVLVAAMVASQIWHPPEKNEHE